MEDQAVILSYGNTDLPEGTPDRPLVTFALFAYNQEKYIREAVEGALSQTYSPLEIILSDDCSTDRTFEIMEDMAQQYKGEHLVRVRRGYKNLGLLNHFIDVAQFARGACMVVSAGDDISIAERVERIVPMFQNPEFLAGSTDDIIINESSEIVNLDCIRIEKRDSWYLRDQTWIHGATAAYRTDLVKNLPFSTKNLYYEDVIFSDIIKALKKKTFRLKENLVKYRYHNNNISSRHKKDVTEQDEVAIIRWMRMADAKQYCKYSLGLMGGIDHGVIKDIENQWKEFLLLSRWRNLNLFEKIILIYFSKKNGNLMFTFPRIFGKNTLRLFRFLKSKFHNWRL